MDLFSGLFGLGADVEAGAASKEDDEWLEAQEAEEGCTFTRVLACTSFLGASFLLTYAYFAFVLKI